MVLDIDEVVLIDGCLESFNQVFYFFKVFEQSLWWFRKLFNEFCYFQTKDMIRVTSYFSSDFGDGTIDIIFTFFGIH